MKIHTIGARFYGGQVDRIDQGFKELGHEITPNMAEADIIYVNSATVESDMKKIVINKENGIIKGKVIATILDIPVHHLPNVDLEGIDKRLNYCDEVCSISKYVQWQLEHYLGRKNCPVIYQPLKLTKPIKIDEKHRIPFLSIGRRGDANKRFNLVNKSLELLSISPAYLLAVGQDSPYAGNFYMGVASDEDLNDAYNHADFLFMPSKVEGMGLPMLEAASLGVIPIICNDLTTREEFFPSKDFPEYLKVNPTPESIAEFLKKFLSNEEFLKNFKKRILDHFNKNWRDKLTSKAIAQNIIHVYDQIAK